MLNHFSTIYLNRIIQPPGNDQGFRNSIKKQLFVPTPRINPEMKKRLMEKYGKDQELLKELTGISFLEPSDD